MDECLCSNCHTLFTGYLANCPQCNTQLVWEGDETNIIQRLEPNCLIHRYDGSDLLEPAVIIKVCKSNIKVATKLKEYTTPVAVPKHKVYNFNQNLLSSIQALRNERTAAVMRYDRLIQSHWQNLKPLNP